MTHSIREQLKNRLAAANLIGAAVCSLLLCGCYDRETTASGTVTTPVACDDLRTVTAFRVEAYTSRYGAKIQEWYGPTTETICVVSETKIERPQKEKGE